MTLAQLRLELERGRLVATSIPELPANAKRDGTTQQLHAIAMSRKPGPRLQLPRIHMPVLP
jgi:hypothetical protein